MERELEKLAKGLSYMTIIDGYLHQDESIDDLIEKFKDFMSLNQKENYETRIAHLGMTFEIFSDIITLKKLKGNYKDSVKLIKLLKEMLIELDETFKSE